VQGGGFGLPVYRVVHSGSCAVVAEQGFGGHRGLAGGCLYLFQSRAVEVEPFQELTCLRCACLQQEREQEKKKKVRSEHSLLPFWVQ
jgi:hypothetical protein